MKIENVLIISLVIQKILSKEKLFPMFEQTFNNLDVLAIKLANEIDEDCTARIVVPDKDEIRPEQNIIIRRISRKFPTKISNYNGTLYLADANFNLWFPKRRYYNDGATIYVALAYLTTSIKEPAKYLQVLRGCFIWAFTNKLRVIYMIIYHEDEIEDVVDSAIRSLASIILYRSELLDFSVVHMNLKTSLQLVYGFDRFASSFSKVIIDSKTNLLPNQSINGRGMVLAIKTGKSVRIDKQDLLRSSISYLDSVVPVVSLALQKMIFSFQIYKSRVHDKDESFVFSLMQQPVEQLHQASYMWWLNSFHEFEKVVAVVPLYEDPSVQYGYNLFVFAGTVASTIVGIRLLSKRCSHLKDRFWHGLNILELTIGMPAEVPPHNSIQKIIFLTFAVISLIYTADFYSGILEINYENKILQIKSLKQLRDFDFDVYVKRLLVRRFDDDDNDIDECLNKISRKIGAMCVSTESDLAGKLTRRMLMVKPVLYHQKWVHILKDRCPYAEQLQPIYDRLFECGINRYFKREPRPIDYSENSEKENKIFVKILVIVSIVGYGVSVLVLLIEFAVAYSKLH